MRRVSLARQWRNIGAIEAGSNGLTGSEIKPGDNNIEGNKQLPHLPVEKYLQKA
jgi:hypothetical protein